MDQWLPKFVLCLRDYILQDFIADVAAGVTVGLATKLHDSGWALLFCGALPQPRKLTEQAGFDRQVGAENICPNIEAALQRAAERMRGLQVGTS